MKYSNIFVLSLLASLFLCSCSKDFLNRTPSTVISDAEYWKSSSDLQLYCNSFYNAFPDYRGFGSLGIYGLDADRGSDNMITLAPNDWLNGRLSVANSGAFPGQGYGWGPLRNINYLLAHYGTVNDTWDNIKPYVGEALFFRSYFYFGMLKTFGDLPWVTMPLTPSDSAQLYSGRVARNIVTDSMIANLDSAISYLPSRSTAQVGRVYKELAMALKARIALFEGTWEKYHRGDPFAVEGSDGTKFLEKAAEASKAIMSSNIFSLDNESTGATNGYWSLFNQTDYSASKEIMFARNYSVDLRITHNWGRYSIGGAGRGVTKSLVDDYLCIDGQPISVSPLYKGDDSLTWVVANRDPRLNQTIYVDDGKHIITNNRPNGGGDVFFTVPSFAAPNESKPATGYQVYKGNNPDYYQQYAAEVGTTALILFRYAEVLLNYAEAKAELGTLSQADVDISINLLRRRVGMPDLKIGSIVTDPNWKFPDLSPVINEIRRERRVELACEGYRTDDILRWAAADKLIVGWQPKGAKKAQWSSVVESDYLDTYPEDANGYIETFGSFSTMSAGYQFNVKRDYLKPIPLSEIQVPGNKIDQNPGWEL